MKSFPTILSVILATILFSSTSYGGGWRTLPRGKYAKPGSKPLVVWDEDLDDDEDDSYATRSAPRFSAPTFADTSHKENVHMRDREMLPDDDAMDKKVAYAPTGIRDVARQMRFQATQCRQQARQAQMNTQQMAMFANSSADAAMVMSVNNMGQVSAQFAELYDRMADDWEQLDTDEKEFFDNMREAKSVSARTAKFIAIKGRLQRMIERSDTAGAWKLYVTTRRAIMAFIRSIDPEQNAEEWIKIQDEYYMRQAIQQQENLRQNAMNMAIQSFAGANESFKKSLEASKLPSRRCGACNKQYYGYGGCPQCSGPRYGLSSKLIDDVDHPGEKVRIYW